MGDGRTASRIPTGEEHDGCIQEIILGVDLRATEWATISESLHESIKSNGQKLASLTLAAAIGDQNPELQALNYLYSENAKKVIAHLRIIDDLIMDRLRVFIDEVGNDQLKIEEEFHPRPLERRRD